MMLPSAEVLGYSFVQPERLQQALTHKSYAYEYKIGWEASNERLEFLGDAVLELLISGLLYERLPEHTEGELSKARAALVCEASLSAYAKQLGLGEFLRLGRGEVTSGGAEKGSILSDALEAVIGAIYLDGGFEPARAFVTALFDDKLDEYKRRPRGGVDISDPKSSLQETIQKHSRVPLVYSIISETGPAHQREFTISVSHLDQILGTGVGKSKKDAERQAAFRALEKIG